jgi:hypothetical protein
MAEDCVHLVDSPGNLRVLRDNASNHDRYAGATFPRLIDRQAADTSQNSSVMLLAPGEQSDKADMDYSTCGKDVT